MSATDDIHLMTVDEYERAAEHLGWDQTELIRGVVYDVSPEHNRHSATVMHLSRVLQAAFPDDDVRVVGSVQLGPKSCVQPDGFVIRADARLELDGLIQDEAVSLVVEVSVTTLWRDQQLKLSIYADAGIPEVWIIDPRPEAGWLLRHTDPSGDAYATIERFDVGENAVGLDVSPNPRHANMTNYEVRGTTGAR